LSPLIELSNLKIVDVQWNQLDNEDYCTNIDMILNKSNPYVWYTGNNAPPGDVSASDGTYSGIIQVNWSDVCNGPYETSSYQVSRTGGPTTEVFTSDWQESTDYSDTSVVSGYEYTYWVTTRSSDVGVAGDASDSDTGYCQ